MSSRPYDAASLGGASIEVLDHLLEGCQIISPEFRYLYVNDLAVKQAHRPRSELIGQTMMACYPGIEATPMFAALSRSMRERVADHFENEFTFGDGRKLVFDLRFLPVPQGVCVLSLDITARRQQLAAIVSDSADAIIGCRPDGLVTSWNKSAERIFGHPASDMVGRFLGQVLPVRAGPDTDLVARVLAGEHVLNHEAVGRHRDGRAIDVTVTLSQVSDSVGGVAGVSAIVRDNTELRRAHEREVTARETAEAANRELEAFSYSVAHDLRAPLRSIDGFSQALLEDYGPQLDDGGRKYLRFVRESAQLMAKLIDDMLMLSRVTRAELVREPVDLSALAKTTISRLRRATPGRVVEVTIEDGLVVSGDARLLAVVVDNLLGNAWKFTGKTAAPHIFFGRAAGSPAQAFGQRAYEVRDNGAGFDMAFAKKLFGAFQRLHGVDEFDGTGIGLATVQRIVLRHGGRTWADAEVGRGASIAFSLGEDASR
ncbi:MAG: PAS domain-containing protein [Archangium sp.]|nr:PAS domain-containing protein [Archangium sp.]